MSKNDAVLKTMMSTIRRACDLGVVPVLLLSALLSVSTGYAAEEATVAVVDFDFVDTSLGGEMQGSDPADLARLERTEDQIRKLLDKSDVFKVVGEDVAERISKELRKNQYRLYECNSCEMRIGKELGADYVLVGWVQKVSNLILNLNLVLRKVPGGEDIVGSSVDMRGNTDEAWSRAAEYIMERELLAEFDELQASKD